jgi:hypothetical protein
MLILLIHSFNAYSSVLENNRIITTANINQFSQDHLYDIKNINNISNISFSYLYTFNYQNYAFVKKIKNSLLKIDFAINTNSQNLLIFWNYYNNVNLSFYKKINNNIIGTSLSYQFKWLDSEDYLLGVDLFAKLNHIIFNLGYTFSHQNEIKTNIIITDFSMLRLYGESSQEDYYSNQLNFIEKNHLINLQLRYENKINFQIMNSTLFVKPTYFYYANAPSKKLYSTNSSSAEILSSKILLNRTTLSGNMIVYSYKDLFYFNPFINLSLSIFDKNIDTLQDIPNFPYDWEWYKIDLNNPLVFQYKVNKALRIVHNFIPGVKVIWPQKISHIDSNFPHHVGWNIYLINELFMYIKIKYYVFSIGVNILNDQFKDFKFSVILNV